MNIVILNRLSHKRASYEKLIKGNHNLYLLCDSVRKKDFEELANYKSKIFFDDWRMNNEIENEILGIFSEEKIDRIIALSESDITRAATIRDLYEIPGQSLESATAFRDKIVMKEYLQKQGIRTPQFRMCSTIAEITQAVRDIGYPIVIKPVDGAGSENTSIFNNFTELDNYLKFYSNESVDIEEFIEGDMYHIDGFYKNGTVEFVQPSRYINGCLAFKDGNYLGSVTTSEDNPLFKKLIEFNLEVLNALPTPSITTFHTEIFVTNKNELVFCEVACRTGGGRIHDTVRLHTGFDLFECSITENVNQRYEFNKIPMVKHHGFALIPPKKGKIVKIPTKPVFDFLKDFSVSASEGQSYTDPTRSIDSYVSYIVDGVSEEDVEKNITIIAEWINKNILWELI